MARTFIYIWVTASFVGQRRKYSIESAYRNHIKNNMLLYIGSQPRRSVTGSRIKKSHQKKSDFPIVDLDAIYLPAPVITDRLSSGSRQDCIRVRIRGHWRCGTPLVSAELLQTMRGRRKAGRPFRLDNAGGAVSSTSAEYIRLGASVETGNAYVF